MGDKGVAEKRVTGQEGANGKTLREGRNEVKGRLELERLEGIEGRGEGSNI